jgi:hypothetical protein
VWSRWSIVLFSGRAVGVANEVSGQSLRVSPGAEFAKLRNRWGLVGLSLIRLGIWRLLWSYFIDRASRVGAL